MYRPNGILCTLGWLFYSQPKNILKHRQQYKDDFCWKYLDHSENNCEGLTQWSFVSLGATLNYTTLNLNDLSNWLESNECIYCDRWNHKNWHPCHDLPQTCGWKKSICPVWIIPTDNLQSLLRTSFRVNEIWPNKYGTQN